MAVVKFKTLQFVSFSLNRSVTHFYSHGDTCDLTGRPREVQVRLKCAENMQPHAVSIYLIEPSTCEYILGVSVNSLIF